MGSSGHGGGAPGVFWAWVEGATSNMALALEGLVEQVQSWTVVGGLSGLGLSSSMDTLNTLLVGWIIFSVLIVILGSFFYVQFVQKLRRTGIKAIGQSEGEDEEVCEDVGEAVVVGCRQPTIVPLAPPDHPPPPVATGADPDAVRWATNIFTWLFNSQDGGPAVRKIFLDTINDSTVRTALETGILVEVMEVYRASLAPSLHNMVVDCTPTDNMTITCDCEATLYLRVMTTRTQGETTTESEYACAVTSLVGRLNIAVVTDELMAVVKFDGWPEVSMEIEGIRNNTTGLDEQQMVEVIDEVVTSALRNSVYDVNFQPVKTFPRFSRARQAPERVIPVGYDSMAVNSSSSGPSLGIPGLNGKRLLVKIVKAAGVGCEKPVTEGYAVVEMDEPSQKFTTSVVKDTNSPFWDEQFLFDLSDGTLELLFEVYDKRDGAFLGLGIVGIEELVATPSQRQIIPLQSRPYENDEVSGSLTVEFLFLDRADLPDLTLRTSATSQSLSSRGDVVTTTTTTYVKAKETQDVVVNGGDGVAAAALRDIEDKRIPANNASRSTMIIHASRKPDDEGETTEVPAGDPSITATPTITTVTQPSPTRPNATPDTPTDAEEPDADERGRSRGNRRKRDSFFGTLKKRFSRSKVRSKSMDPNARDMSLDRDMSVGRSVSMERTAASGLLAVPAGGDGGSTRSSLSDASAISSSSTRTYVNEASTLIVETKENGVLKHYLIPLSLQQKSKWRKKGIKLHVFGEHTFVAKHMSSSTPCQVCQKTLGRRFGKQGYECRDCGFKCHKPCHVKTDTICPNSTVNTMDLEYVKDPREERRAWMKKAKTT